MATVKLDPQCLLGFRLSASGDATALSVKLGEKAGAKAGGKGSPA